LDDSPENVTAKKRLGGRIPVGKKSSRIRPERLTPQQKKFAEGVAKGLSDKDAALAAGFAESTAKNTKDKLWKKHSLRDYYRKLIRTAHPPKRLVQALSELVDGKSIVTRVQKVVDQKGNTVESKVERVETVDANVRLRAVQEVQQLAGYVPAKGEGTKVKAGEEMQTQGPGGKEVRIRVVYSESPPKEEDDEEEEP
jgi:phage terminase small subunit